MTNCDKYLDMISSYVDGELSEEEKAELLAHVERCPSCRSILHAYETIAQETGELLSDPPAELKERVMAQIGETGGRQRKNRRFVFGRYTALAACLALILLVLPRLSNFGCSSSTTYDLAEIKNEQAAGDYFSSSLGDEDLVYGEAASDGANGEESALTEADTASSDDTSATAGGDAETAVLPRNSADYYAVITITGQLPDILKDDEKMDAGDGSYLIDISRETAEALIDEGYEAELGDENLTEALVIYRET
jgi:hypothetical protein